MFEPFGKVATVVVPYTSAVGVCYLFGYWQPFGINPLEYVGLGDVVRLSLYPLALGLGLMALGNIMAQVAGGPKSGGGAETKVGKWMRGNRRFLACLLLLIIQQVILLGGDPYKWVFVTVLTVPFGTALANTDIALALVKNDEIRNWCATVLVVLPVLAFTVGRFNANSVKNGHQKHALEANRIPEDLELRSTAQSPIMYAGRLGDHIVFYETLSAQVVLVPVDRIPTLALREK